MTTPRSADPTVAVVIPTFNRHDLLLEAVASVLGQSYGRLLCLVVDNGSTDGTQDAVEAIDDPRVRLLALPAPVGGPAARNVGVEAAEGAGWVAFLDSDDLWAPDKLQRQMEALGRHPGVAWATTAAASVTEDLRLLQVHRVPLPIKALGSVDCLGDDRLKPLMVEDNIVPAGNSTVIVSRSFLQSVGGYDEHLRTCDDWDLWLRLGSRSPLLYVDEPLAAYRTWGGQASALDRSFVSDAAAVRTRHFPDAGPLPTSYQVTWEQALARRDVVARRRFAASRHYVRAALLGRRPGQLAYALAGAVAPGSTERRLLRLDRADPALAEWEERAESWLAGARRR